MKHSLDRCFFGIEFCEFSTFISSNFYRFLETSVKKIMHLRFFLRLKSVEISAQNFGVKFVHFVLFFDFFEGCNMVPWTFLIEISVSTEISDQNVLIFKIFKKFQKLACNLC